ncbi:MAG: GntR family transcriptional regulator, partial [Lachnospiraceae bacterium]
ISMELLALKTSIHNIRPAEIAELRGDFQRELEAYRRAGGISDQRIAEIDARFHQLIVDKSNNNYIKNLVRVLAAQIRRYQAVAYSLTDTFEESAGQHLGILQKIEERNLDEARELLRAHIEWSYKELAAVML